MLEIYVVTSHYCPGSSDTSVAMDVEFGLGLLMHQLFKSPE